MVERMELQLAGETVSLLADRALYWHAADSLFIADLHLGKGETFRAAGIPVPTGGTSRDLARLSALLDATGASTLWILGDFLHARRSATQDAAWHAFRQRHARARIVVVPGNHDRALGTMDDSVEIADGDVRIGPFTLVHAPPATPRAGHVLCGHLHPVVRLPGLGAQPLFWLAPDITVLPAFSLFTGGMAVSLSAAAGSVVCNGSALVRLD